jgi:calcineurin-like phosphoesterase family protein
MHQNPNLPGPYLNVCVEQTDYRPILFTDAQKLLAEKLETETKAR